MTGDKNKIYDLARTSFFAEKRIGLQKKSDVLKNFKKNVVKYFGPGSAYWKNLKLRKKYKKSCHSSLLYYFVCDFHDGFHIYVQMLLRNISRDNQPGQNRRCTVMWWRTTVE